MKLFDEAKRLHDLGFAILWIKPKSKMPVNNGWTKGPREEWPELLETYEPGMNMGVRLGTPSFFGGRFLAVIDIDVKSTEPHHQKQAIDAFTAHFPELKDAPWVLSGRGNGSSHVYFVTSKPVSANKVKISEDRVKVFMPSAKITDKQKELLTETEIKNGMRIRPAWEIAVMGEGQQVLLPPSLHPDSKQHYAWKKKVTRISDLKLIDLKGNEKKVERESVADWEPVEIEGLDIRLTAETLELLYTAESDDRSASLLVVATAMIRARFNDREIMSVLTDKTFELGHVAYEHAKTGSRKRAADWVYNYTIKKARRENDAQFAFESEVETIELDDDAAHTQAVEVLTRSDWRLGLKRSGKNGDGPPKPTVENIILIIENHVSRKTFVLDEFAYRESYGCATPWGGVEGAALTDTDTGKVMLWLGRNYNFEPGANTIITAMTVMAEENRYNPVKDALEALPQWDGVERLDTWLVQGFEAKGNAEYLAQVFRKWMFAMVLRVYEPGAKFDWMPIFEGAQGVGKSSIGRLLCGGKFFLDWLPSMVDKDAAGALQGAWVVELAELAHLRKNEIEIVKGFLTRTVDKFRPPYGKKLIESARACVFFGTTNQEEYLRDHSGNRRFKPLEVGQLNFKKLEEDRTQLFAEAVFLYKNELENKNDLELTGAAKRYEAVIHEDKRVLEDFDFMLDEILGFIEAEKTKPENERFFATKFKIKSLFQTGAPLERWKDETRYLMAAGRAIRKLGGKKLRSNKEKFWELCPLSAPSVPPDLVEVGTKILQ